MLKKFAGFLIVTVLLLCQSPVALAQTYLFSVEETVVDATVNEDGTLTLDYTITFLNDPSADAIDYVDIGIPTSAYSISNVSAQINGVTISDIEDSPYVNPGIALGLGSNAIQPGKTGTVHVSIAQVQNVFYEATNEESEPYASFQFTPNYFGSEYVHNTPMKMTVTLYLPAGMNADEPRWFEPDNWPGDSTPTSKFTNDDRIYYQWTTDNASASRQYTFGASFPMRLIPENIIVTEPAMQLPAFQFNEDSVICLCFSSFFILIFGLGFYQSIWGAKKRKLKYLPPKVSIEGHGIKRGLTAVEAAILLENPMDKVLTMILFSVIKKGAAEVITKEPLDLKITEPLSEDLRSYEKDFLVAFRDQKGKARTKAMQSLMVDLVRSVTTKMKGFSHKETVAYYKTIMEKAWKMVEDVDTPDVKVAKYDEVMDWTMLDRDFDKRTQTVFVNTPTFYPIWWGRFDPTYRSAGAGRISTPVSSSSSGGKTFSVPNLPGSDFAASMVNGMQAFSAGVVGDLTNFTGNITSKTNPVPVRTSSGSSHSGGGGGCACACACAGCACACAGGGR